MEDHEIIALIKKYQEGTLTPKEKALLDSWYMHQSSVSDSIISDTEVRESLNIIGQNLGIVSKRRIWIPAAAAILITIISITLYLTVFNGWEEKPIKQYAQSPYILPGGNRATLTLSSGLSVELSSNKEGIVVSAENIEYDDGSNVLEVEHTLPFPVTKDKETTYNTLSTPRGGQYQIILPDGSKVWLNAQTTLKYPSRFSGEKREVELEGEAYFDIKKHKGEEGQNLAFIVKTHGQEVQVLGTEFNISAYKDEEQIKTTLIDGLVKVSANGQSVLLNPGYESSLSHKGIHVYEANIKSAINWKSGFFYFDKADLKTVMRQLSRWYDVEVLYDTKRSGDEFMGKIPRDKPLVKVLEILRLSGINFRIEGRKLIVLDQ